MSVAWTRISAPADQQTGALKWKFVSEGPVLSSPALAGGIVYFASDDGKFYAIHAATGRLEWACETAGERRYAGRHLHVTSSGRDHAGPLELFSFFPAVWTVPWISEAAMATCMPWTPCWAA